MARFLIYRTSGGVSMDKEDGTPRFVFFSESDVKQGIVVPRSNPLLSRDPEGEVVADNVTDARRVFLERRSNAFGG